MAEEPFVVELAITIDDEGDIAGIAFKNGQALSPAEAGLILIDAARCMIALASEADQETEH